MYQVLLIMFLLVSVSLCILIMLQQGKGADIGVSLNSTASGSLFGASGSSNCMTRMTAILAALFFFLSLVLDNISSKHKQQKDTQWENLKEIQEINTDTLVNQGSDNSP